MTPLETIQGILASPQSGIFPDESVDEFVEDLIQKKLVHSKDDAKVILLEALTAMASNDDAFPVQYFDDNEELPEEQKIVTNQPEALTDNYVKGLQ